MIILKPDAFRRRLISKILLAFEPECEIEVMYSGKMSQTNCRIHYAAHVHKPYFPGLVAHMTSGISLFVLTDMPWDRERELALRIRADYGSCEGPRNLIHASDSLEANHSESDYWFARYPHNVRAGN